MRKVYSPNLRYNIPYRMAAGSTIAVYSALIGNSLVMVAKFAAYFITGSSAMLSEGIHSFADVSNQALLAFGIRRSKKRPDRKHPYGYTRERFIWALISAVGIFFLGCGVTVYHGLHTLADPRELSEVRVAYLILTFSFIIEGITLLIAYRSIQGEAKARRLTVLRYLSDSTDPMGIAVLLEDAAAVIGVLIAGAGLAMAQWTGNVMWDGIATILIGLLLGAVAIFLTYRTRGLLVGQAIPAASRSKILALLRNDPVVDNVYDVKTAIMGAHDLRFKAEIEFDGEHIAEEYLKAVDLEKALEYLKDKNTLKRFLIQYGDHLIDRIGDEVDRLEEKIRAAVPDVTHVDIETD